MLTNQLKVMLQRVYNGERKPAKILLSRALREALGMENNWTGLYHRHDRGDTFATIPIAVVSNITSPIIELVPENGKPGETQIRDLL